MMAGFGFFKKCRNLLRQSCPRQRHLHVENNPYPEGHPCSYHGYLRVSSLPVGFAYILCAVPLCFGSWMPFPRFCFILSQPEVKSSDLLSLWNMRRTTLCTAEKRRLKSVRSSRKKRRRLSSMAKTQWRWLVLTILKDMAVVRSMELLKRLFRWS